MKEFYVIISHHRRWKKNSEIFKNSDIPVPLQTDRKTKSSFNLFQKMWAHRHFSAVIRYTSTTSNCCIASLILETSCFFVILICFVCLFRVFRPIWEFFQSYGDSTIAGEVLHILSCAQRSWPLSSGILACHNYLIRGIRL